MEKDSRSVSPDIFEHYEQKARTLFKSLDAWQEAKVKAMDLFNGEMNHAIMSAADMEVKSRLADIKYQANKRFYDKHRTRA